MNKIIQRAIVLFGCDSARIATPVERHFLILGWNARSENEWLDQDGKTFNFNYVREQVVASGATLMELWSSAKYYHRLLKQCRGWTIST